MRLDQISNYKWKVLCTTSSNDKITLWTAALRIFIEIISDEVYSANRSTLNLNSLSKYDLGQILCTSKHHRRKIVPILLYFIENNDQQNRTWTRLLINFSQSRFLFCHIFYSKEKRTHNSILDCTFILTSERTREYDNEVLISTGGSVSTNPCEF